MSEPLVPIRSQNSGIHVVLAWTCCSIPRDFKQAKSQNSVVSGKMQIDTVRIKRHYVQHHITFFVSQNTWQM